MTDWTCPDCGATNGDGVQRCPDCAREDAESRGHSGSCDVFGNWICFNQCPACHPDE